MHRLVSLAALAALVVGCGMAAPAPASITTPVQSPSAGPASPAALTFTSLAPSTQRPTVSPVTTPPATASPPVLFGSLPTTRFPKAKAAALQAVLDSAVRDGAPDAYAAVITKDGTWAGAAGTGGPDGRAATAQDEFYLASTTQVFTTALILRLAEEGRMDLDAPLASYLGALKVDTNGATVRQALGMRSGLPDYEPTEVQAAIRADARHVWSHEEVITHFVKPTSAPGTTLIHAGPNFVLLALAAEHLTGSSFSAALRTEVLDPVGATRIVQQDHGVVTPKPWALPTKANAAPIALTDYGADGVISYMSSVSFAFGSGSMAGDAASVAEWAWHLMAGDVLKSASLQAMMPGADGHGSGLERLSDLGDRDVIGLTGSKTGYSSMLAIVPAEQAVVVFYLNDPEFIFEAYVRDLLAASEGG
jgi:D-alanyl-D-alanine carboxypeptidase